MGIIARQSFKSGIVTYFGILMGMVNVIILYPLFLDVEEIGILSFITSTAGIFTPFILLGFGNVVLRYFSHYQENQNSKNYFFSLGVTVVGISSVLFFLGFLLFNSQIQQHFAENGAISKMVILVLFLIASILPTTHIVQLYCSSYGRTAVPALFNQFYKFITPILACGYFLDFYSFNTVLIGLAIFHVALLVITLLYFKTLDDVNYRRPKLSEIKSDENMRPMLKFALFSIVGGIGYSFSNQIDMVMIADLSSTYNLGLYSWAFNIANAMATPAVLIIGIASPIIAKHLKNNEIQDIGKIYLQSASTLLTICLGVFMVICLTIDDLFQIMAKGDEFMLSKTTFIMLGIAKLLEVTISINNHIISLSKFYIWNVVFLVFSSIINVGLNFILIPKYGIEGCAAATIASVFVFSLIKIIFVYRKYKIQPFSLNQGLILVLALGLFSVIQFVLPSFGNNIIHIIAAASIFGLLYSLLVYRYRLAPELNDFANKQLDRIGFKPFDKK